MFLCMFLCSKCVCFLKKKTYIHTISLKNLYTHLEDSPSGRSSPYTPKFFKKNKNFRRVGLPMRGLLGTPPPPRPNSRPERGARRHAAALHTLKTRARARIIGVISTFETNVSEMETNIFRLIYFPMENI